MATVENMLVEMKGSNRFFSEIFIDHPASVCADAWGLLFISLNTTFKIKAPCWLVRLLRKYNVNHCIMLRRGSQHRNGGRRGRGRGVSKKCHKNFKMLKTIGVTISKRCLNEKSPTKI